VATAAMRPLLVLTTTLCTWLVSFVAGDRRGEPPPLFSFTAKDNSAQAHHQFGLALGTRFKQQINARVESNSDLQHTMLPFYATPNGRTIYDQFLTVHSETFPLYIAELQGMADGSQVPFSTLFIQNLALEYGSVANPPDLRTGVDACTDYALCTTDVCIVGHNDDNDVSLLNRTALVSARFGGSFFTGFAYLGDLVTGAFGYNNHGIAFSLNWVGPNQVRRGALGRAFLSRSLLDAQSWNDAIDKITVPNQSAGHNYQLMDYLHRRVVNIETAPGQVYSFRSITEPFFHTNQYVSLQLPQHYNNSSKHRTARLKQLPAPYTRSAVLDILGDQHDVQYPIFHDQLSHERGELSDWTLASVLFDLDDKTMTMYHGNPARQQPMLQLALAMPAEDSIKYF